MDSLPKNEPEQMGGDLTEGHQENLLERLKIVLIKVAIASTGMCS